MKVKRTLVTALVTLMLFSAANAQKAELTVNFNEAFFDALLDSVFQNLEPIEFPISQRVTKETRKPGLASSFAPPTATCPESIRILREQNGVRTAVRFREGKIYVPLAFSGNYSPPFVGCVEFAGWAESNLELEFDAGRQRVIGRARVLNVNLNGTNGVGGTVIARMIQSSIDKKLNPIEIVSLEKMSFLLPVRGAGSVKARAVSVQPEVNAGSVTLRIAYVFEKG